MYNTGVSVDINMSKSADDLIAESVFLDMTRVCACFMTMYIYTCIMLNGPSWSNMRPFLTSMGLASVVLGVPIAYGITCAFGYSYMPHFATLPFLMVGLGIDDMFVIMQIFRNLENIKDQSLEERIGLTMKHAGVAITVTSLTDICAFGVGASTVFPGLRAFCVACSVGIAAIYILQATWFVAWLVIDEKRRAKNANCYTLPCINCVSEKFEISDKVWPMFSNLLDHKLYHVLVTLLSAVFLSIGIWGCLTIKQEFRISKFFPR